MITEKMRIQIVIGYAPIFTGASIWGLPTSVKTSIISLSAELLFSTWFSQQTQQRCRLNYILAIYACSHLELKNNQKHLRQCSYLNKTHWPKYSTTLLHYITLHYITLHYIASHHITLHYITLHYHIYIQAYSIQMTQLSAPLNRVIGIRETYHCSRQTVSFHDRRHKQLVYVSNFILP